MARTIDEFGGVRSVIKCHARMLLLLCAVASCRRETPEPWCDWAPQDEAGLSIAVYLTGGGWGAAFAPQPVRIVASRRGKLGLALDSEIKNDGANIDERNLQLSRLRAGALQLRLSGEEQEPACYRLASRELTWQAAACSTDVDQAYSFKRRSGL